MPLPIENNRELLAEYGRAFAWINLVESVLTELIKFKVNFNSLHPVVAKKTNEKMRMLGQKVEFARELFGDCELVKDLAKLNRYRISIAHGAIGEIVELNAPTTSTGRYVLLAEQGEGRALTAEYLKEVVNLSEKISKSVHEEFLKHVPESVLKTS